ncbi:aminotransferase class IV [Flavihumibacter fluvii]|uniref:aminotransferase class IV n=1 Tax=Flavihumibacter fluvii TaxID=2838157 RepID=UPI001BDDFC3B|nr:aminotransferase class IV [Flavihumibacter fluvii]ULQ54258.1 aminotransferase class IV [Flavihumibacter fluvii]
MNSSAQFCLINGQLVPIATAAIGVNDLSLQRGYGIFDFFKVVGGKPVFLDDHLERFLFSAKEMRLDKGLTTGLLTGQVQMLLEKNDLPESGVRLTLTGGYSPDGYSLANPNLVVTQTPVTLNRGLPPGIELMTYPFQRQLPRVKTIDYLMAIWLQPTIRQNQANDVLYKSEGVVRECPRANFFIINNKGELQTTREKLLWGITRKKVLEIAGKFLPVAEKDITVADLAQSREAFITSTTKHITPVIAIDGQKIGPGEPGELTRLLSEGLLHQVFADY